MFPEKFEAGTSSMFPSFAIREEAKYAAKKYFASGNNASRREAKLGNIEETCTRLKCFWKHVSTLCRGLMIVAHCVTW